MAPSRQEIDRDYQRKVVAAKNEVKTELATGNPTPQRAEHLRGLLKWADEHCR